MTESRVIEISRSLYVLVPAEEARRLNLQAGQHVNIELAPIGATLGDLADRIFGKYTDAFVKENIPDEELWGL